MRLYGHELLKQLSRDLTERLGRGFSERNLEQMRLFYLTWPNPRRASANSALERISQTVSAKSGAMPQLSLPWSHYVRLLSVSDRDARLFYEREAICGSWSARQLDRQIATLAYQRSGGLPPLKAESATADAHVRDPFILEFLDLKDEYSETDLEEALIRTMEKFLLEMGSDFASWLEKRDSASEMNGIESTWSSSIEFCAAWSSSQNRQVHPWGCGPDEPIPQLCSRTLDPRI